MRYFASLLGLAVLAYASGGALALLSWVAG